MEKLKGRCHFCGGNNLRLGRDHIVFCKTCKTSEHYDIWLHNRQYKRKIKDAKTY